MAVNRLKKKKVFCQINTCSAKLITHLTRHGSVLFPPTVSDSIWTSIINKIVSFMKSLPQTKHLNFFKQNVDLKYYSTIHLVQVFLMNIFHHLT